MSRAPRPRGPARAARSKAISMPNPKVVAPFPKPAPAYGEVRIHVRDLVLKARIGVHQHERLAYQRIRLNLELTVDYAKPIEDDLDNVLCYARLVTGIRGVVGARHVNLIETLADDIGRMCLEDPRVRAARVRIDKLDVFPEAESVGIEIERRRS